MFACCWLWRLVAAQLLDPLLLDLEKFVLRGQESPRLQEMAEAEGPTGLGMAC